MRRFLCALRRHPLTRPRDGITFGAYLVSGRVKRPERDEWAVGVGEAFLKVRHCACEARWVPDQDDLETKALRVLKVRAGDLMDQLTVHPRMRLL